MPLIQVKIIEGVFSPEQKQDMVKKLTDTMVSIEGENIVFLNEMWKVSDVHVSTSSARTENFQRFQHETRSL